MVGNIIPYIGGEEEKSEIEPLKIFGHIENGEIKLNDTMKFSAQCIRVPVLDGHLACVSFNLENNPGKEVLIEKIKSIIINLIHNQDNKLSFNLSEILSSELGRDYGALSRLFSEVEGRTIEKFFIAQKIERVKELLVYDELTLSEIAYQLNYSSVAHLSNQFKKVTGLTPSFFKQIKDNKRKSLDEV